jgi:hypothetical protein
MPWSKATMAPPAGESLGSHGRPTGEGDDSQQEHYKEDLSAAPEPCIAAHDVFGHAKILSQTRMMPQ